MEYMALVYADEGGWDDLSSEVREQWMERYRAFARDARAAGVMVDGDELAASSDATTARIPGAEYGAIEVRAVHVEAEES